MNWLSRDNQSFDAEKLEAEIEAEIERKKKEKIIPGTDPELEKAFSVLPSPEEDGYLLEVMGKYASGLNEDLLSRRRRLPAPLIRLAVKILKRVFRPQYIFNALAAEALRKQEERIKILEKRIQSIREN